MNTEDRVTIGGLGIEYLITSLIDALAARDAAIAERDQLKQKLDRPGLPWPEDVCLRAKEWLDCNAGRQFETTERLIRDFLMLGPTPVFPGGIVKRARNYLYSCPPGAEAVAFAEAIVDAADGTTDGVAFTQEEVEAARRWSSPNPLTNERGEVEDAVRIALAVCRNVDGGTAEVLAAQPKVILREGSESARIDCIRAANTLIGMDGIDMSFEGGEDPGQTVVIMSSRQSVSLEELASLLRRVAVLLRPAETERPEEYAG